MDANRTKNSEKEARGAHGEAREEDLSALRPLRGERVADTAATLLAVAAVVLALFPSVRAWATRPFLSDETVVWNQSPVKRPGTTRFSRWQAAAAGAARPLSSTTGRAELLVHNLTDQKLCVGVAARTSAAVPDCAVAFPVGVCASAAHARMMPDASWILPISYSDQFGVGVLCGSTVGAVGNSEYVYTAQSSSTQVMLGATAPVCGNGLCEYGETAVSCPADCG